jgi:tripartite-type tricarboxylate transporter receptor subunit TctC
MRWGSTRSDASAYCLSASSSRAAARRRGDFELLPRTAMYAPKGTPRPVVGRLAAALQASLSDADLVSHYAKLGLLTASPGLASPAGLQAHPKAEVDKWGSIIRKAGVFAD